MKKYTLTKTVKGSNFVYTVKDENGTVISTRTSRREYVACTANGEFYFGRRDLIGKGDHGRGLRVSQRNMNYTVKDWESDKRNFTRLYGPKTADKYYRIEEQQEYIESLHERGRERHKVLSEIAYLE